MVSTIAFDLFQALDVRAIAVVKKGAAVGIPGVMAQATLLASRVESGLFHVPVPPDQILPVPLVR